MANARTRFDTICEYMVRAHGASIGSQYNKPCALVRGEAFLYFHQEWAAFRLRGRVRLQALALPGAKFWDPLGREGPSMDWVIVPDRHFLRWDRFAVEAVKQAEKVSGGRRPEAGPAQGPVPLPPASLRWLDGIKGLLAKAAALTLARQEPVAEKPVPQVFMESNTPPPAEAEAFAELAGASDAEAAASAGAPATSGRASFDVAEATPAAPAGRASFALPEDPPAQAEPAAAGRASFALPEDPPAPAVPAGKASFALPEDSPEQPPAEAPPADTPGRASFAAADELDEPAPAPTSTPAGRASFALPDDAPAPPVASSQGRASFALPDDPPASPPAAAAADASAASVAEADAAAPEESEAKATDTTAEPDAQPDWAARAAKYQLEQERPQVPSGRAVFNIPDGDSPAQGPPATPKPVDKPMGRATFVLPDDVPQDQPDEPEGIDYSRESDERESDS